jgi:hypothetical protein
MSSIVGPAVPEVSQECELPWLVEIVQSLPVIPGDQGLG